MTDTNELYIKAVQYADRKNPREWAEHEALIQPILASIAESFSAGDAYIAAAAQSAPADISVKHTHLAQGEYARANALLHLVEMIQLQ